MSNRCPVPIPFVGVPSALLTACWVLGELFALLALPGFALPGSEFEGLGCRSNAERLALVLAALGGSGPLESECELRGGEADSALKGGVALGLTPCCE